MESKKERTIRLYSKQCLKYSGINEIINLDDPLIKSRICYGFLKKKKIIFQFFNRYKNCWFFIISSKPLTNLGEANDEVSLDESILNGTLRFDVLYYYVKKSKNQFIQIGEIDLK